MRNHDALKSSSKADLKKLAAAAKKARKNAHAPYSGFKVGAALLAKDGTIFTGGNVENASYGGTVCAERVAVFKAVSEGSVKFTDICVFTDGKEPWPPCGFCRQVLAEFCGPELRVHLANDKGVRRTLTLGELLPEAFTPAHLK